MRKMLAEKACETAAVPGKRMCYFFPWIRDEFIPLVRYMHKAVCIEV